MLQYISAIASSCCTCSECAVPISLFFLHYLYHFVTLGGLEPSPCEGEVYRCLKAFVTISSL